MATAPKSYQRRFQPASKDSPQGPRVVRPAVTVLMISPFEADRIAFRYIFSHSNWRLVEAASRREALPLLEGTLPQVIVCDTEIPDAAWQQILDELALRENPPLLIITSRLADDDLWAEVLNLGGFDVLMKPFDATEIVRVIGLAWRHYIESEKPKVAVAGG